MERHIQVDVCYSIKPVHNPPPKCFDEWAFEEEVFNRIRERAVGAGIFSIDSDVP